MIFDSPTICDMLDTDPAMASDVERFLILRMQTDPDAWDVVMDTLERDVRELNADEGRMTIQDV